MRRADMLPVTDIIKKRRLLTEMAVPSKMRVHITNLNEVLTKLVPINQNQKPFVTENMVLSVIHKSPKAAVTAKERMLILKNPVPHLNK